MASAAPPASGPAERPTPLSVATPKGWLRQIIDSRTDGLSYRYSARERAGPLSMNLLFRRDPPGRTTDDVWLRDLVHEAAQEFVDDSVENRIDLRPLPGGDGYAVTLTDASPATRPTRSVRFGCVTVIGRRVGDGVLLSRVMHPKDSVNLPRAMEMIQAAAPAGAPTTRPATAPATRPTTLRLAIPGAAWAAAIDLPDAPLKPERRRQGKGSFSVVADLPDGTECTISIDPPQAPGGPRDVRTFVLEQRIKPAFGLKRYTLSGSKDVALLAYQAGGPQRSALAVRVEADQWVMVQLNNPLATDADQRVMMRLLKTFRIERAAPTTTTAPAE